MNAAALLRPLRLDSTPTEGRLLTRGMTTLFGLVAQGLIRLAITIAVGRLAGAADLGVVAAGMATAQFLILLWPTTCGQAAARFLARCRGAQDEESALAVADHLRRRLLLAAAALSLVSVPISLARGLDAFGAGCVALFLWGVAGQQFTRGVHYGAGAIGRVVILDIGFSLLGLLALIVALESGVRGPSLLLPPALAHIALSVACWPWSPVRRAERALRRELDSFVFFGSLGTLASAGLVQLSVLVADRLGPLAAGHYAAAVNLAMPLTLISGALSLVLYPTMSQAVGRGDTQAVRRQLDVGVRGLLLVAVPVLTLAAVLAPELVALGYGPGFQDSARVLPILLAAILVAMLAMPCVNALTSRDSRGIVEMAAASMAGLALAVLGWAVWAPRIGIVGVGAGYAVGAAIIALYAIARAWALWRLSWAAPAGCALLGVGVAAALVAGLVEQPWQVRAGAGIGCALGWLLVRRRDVRLVRQRLRGPGRPGPPGRTGQTPGADA